MTTIKRAAATLGAALLLATPPIAGLPGIGALPAFAGNGHGGGGGGGGGGGNGGDHGNGHGHGNSGAHGQAGASYGHQKLTTASADTGTTTEDDTPPPNAHGLMASELKGLNAYHASPTAFENAAPGSQVGLIAAYREAAITAQPDDAKLAADKAALAAALADPNYQGQPTVDELQAAVAYDEANPTQAQLDEQAALDAATHNRTLSDAALAYFRQQLGLDTTTTN
ncbi:hypothetical protein [Solirhodobacter olei]|uniref:hypothetical protein n=1 Tax=Solirhodobacter olei TaxID=2493082 RepID=UPI000FDB9BCF|nr:hypothetical protein [Solirhodobacter olei]